MNGRAIKKLKIAVAQTGIKLTAQGWRRLKAARRNDPSLDVTAFVQEMQREDATELWRNMTPAEQQAVLQSRMHSQSSSC